MVKKAAPVFKREVDRQHLIWYVTGALTQYQVENKVTWGSEQFIQELGDAAIFTKNFLADRWSSHFTPPDHHLLIARQAEKVFGDCAFTKDDWVKFK